MAVTLITPWAGHPAGATLTLSAYDEQALVRGGAAVVAQPNAETRAAMAELEARETAPLSAPVTKPARGGRKKA